jgi:anti-anti-sigma factor
MEMNEEPELTIAIEGEHPPVLRLGGELDLATAPSIRRAVSSAVADETPERVVFDMAGVSFMDSSGLSALLEVAATTPVTVRNPSNAVRRVIETTGLSGVLTLETQAEP